MTADYLDPRHFQLTPDRFSCLGFRDFPGAGIDEVADYLYQHEPHFMGRLEADIRQHGVSQPVELGTRDTIEDGHHRMAAAYRAGRPVPVALYGQEYPRDASADTRWRDIRREHPAEYAARMAFDPDTWDCGLSQPEAEREAG